MELITARPREAESSFDLTPFMPREGTSYSMVTSPSLVGEDMLTIAPLRWLSRSMAEPEYSSGSSMSTSSKGSCLSPPSVFSMTCGQPMYSSKPSRRIVSISTVRCSSPRPETSTVSPGQG